MRIVFILFVDIFSRFSQPFCRKMAIEEKKSDFAEKKIVSSYLSPNSPNDLHTYSESPWSAECQGKLKTFEAFWDKSELKRQKSIFSTVFDHLWEKKSWLVSEIFKLWKIGCELDQMD